MNFLGCFHYSYRIEEKEKAINAVVNVQNDPMCWRYATWQTETETFITVSPGRGISTIEN